MTKRFADELIKLDNSIKFLYHLTKKLIFILK